MTWLTVNNHLIYLEPGLLECLYHLLLVHIEGQVANVGSVGRSVRYPLILDARPQSSPGSGGQDHGGLAGRLVAHLVHLVGPGAAHGHGHLGSGPRGSVGTASLIAKELSQVQGLPLVPFTCTQQDEYYP